MFHFLQVYGPSVSDQPSESTGTALFTRYLSCRLHANLMQSAWHCHLVAIPTMCSFPSCADSCPLHIPVFWHISPDCHWSCFIVHIYSAVCNMTVCSSFLSPRASAVNPRGSIVKPGTSFANPGAKFVKPRASSHR